MSFKNSTSKLGFSRKYVKQYVGVSFVLRECQILGCWGITVKNFNAMHSTVWIFKRYQTHTHTTKCNFLWKSMFFSRRYYMLNFRSVSLRFTLAQVWIIVDLGACESSSSLLLSLKAECFRLWGRFYAFVRGISWRSNQMGLRHHDGRRVWFPSWWRDKEEKRRVVLVRVFRWRSLDSWLCLLSTSLSFPYAPQGWLGIHSPDTDVGYPECLCSLKSHYSPVYRLI